MRHFSGIFILLCFVTVIVFWLISARSAKPMLEQRGFGIARRFLFVLAFVIITLRILGVFHTPGGELWNQSLFSNLLADAVTLLGVIITIWARVILGGNWSANVQFKQGHELIERGPSSRVRHPIYTGILLMFAGVVIYHASITSLVIFAAMFIVFWIKAGSEEQLMTEHFPNEYPSYKARTRRLIPYVL